MDKKFLSNAINLAKKNNGITAPNPSVGCVIVKNNEIIATGITGKEGSPHAEYAAINSVKDKNLLKGSSIYVSLEPCCHFGKNPPCIDIIVKNKIARVIIATIDKNPKISGKSIEILQKNGIEVKILSQNDTDEFYEPFFKAVTKKIPYISLKFGVSLDGKIATKDFDSKWITSQESRLYTHHLRSINDAILIGSGTLKKDNPLLDCRILGLENYSPKRFVIANNLDFDENLQLFQSALKFPVYILLNKNFRGNISAFEKFGVKIILCEEKNGDVDLQFALKKIYENGVNSVLVEGGSKIATNFLQQNLVDKLIWMQSKKIIGNDGLAAIGELGFSKVSQALNNFTKKEFLEFVDDVILIFS